MFFRTNSLDSILFKNVNEACNIGLIAVISKPISNKIANLGLFCSFLIVCNHVRFDAEIGTALWWWQQCITWGIATVAVPCFFVISGFLLAGHMCDEGWYKIEVAKRIRTLVVPSYIWIAIRVAFLSGIILIANVAAHKPPLTNIRYGINDIISWLGFNPYSQPGLGVLWYVRALLMFVLISPILKRMSTWFGVIVLFAVYGIVCPWESMAFGTWKYPLRFFFSLEGLAYFTLGIFLRFHDQLLSVGKCKMVIAFCVGCAGMILQAWGSYKGWTCAYYFRWASLPFVMYALWAIVSDSCIARRLTACSFPVFLIHIFIITIINKIGAHVSIFPFNGTNIVEWVAQTLIIFWGSVLVAIGLRRFFPRFARIAFGGR